LSKKIFILLSIFLLSDLALSRVHRACGKGTETEFVFILIPETNSHKGCPYVSFSPLPVLFPLSLIRRGGLGG